MIDPQIMKKYIRIYSVVALMSLTTIGISELTKPSYALLKSTSQTSMTFSATDSYPQKVVPNAVQELVPSQTSEEPSDGVAEERGKTDVDSEPRVQSGENPANLEEQTLEIQHGGDMTVDSTAQSGEMGNEETEAISADAHQSKTENGENPNSTELSQETNSAINQTNLQ